MFDKKSEYALNKHDQDSIIYISVSGHIRLTRADFSSEEEFLKWKAWSDEDYYGVRFTWRRGQGCSKHPMPIFLLLERTDAHGYVTWISHSSRKTGSTRCGYPN